MNQLVPENLNISAENVQECLKEINNIGSTTYQNVCNGASSTVPWGSGDEEIVDQFFDWLRWEYSDISKAIAKVTINALKTPPEPKEKPSE